MSAFFIFRGFMQQIVAGDTLKMTLSYPEYSSDEYDIAISMRSSGLDPIDINDSAAGVVITKTGTLFNITVESTVTATWKPGTYSFALYAMKTDERYTVDTGTITIKPDLSLADATVDLRSHVKKVLDAIEAVIENRATTDQMSYSISGRTLSRIPIPDLIKFRDTYRLEYAREQRMEKIARGEFGGNELRVRF